MVLAVLGKGLENSAVHIKRESRHNHYTEKAWYIPSQPGCTTLTEWYAFLNSFSSFSLLDWQFIHGFFSILISELLLEPFLTCCTKDLMPGRQK
jgi:hypothetical protein